jgi:hypothetical protein
VYYIRVRSNAMLSLHAPVLFELVVCSDVRADHAAVSRVRRSIALWWCLMRSQQRTWCTAPA